jgi:hypothetical protein
MKIVSLLALSLIASVLGCAAGTPQLQPAQPAAPATTSAAQPAAAASASAARVYEIRTYTTHEGRLDALHQRFRDHTLRLFERHGITNVAYWVPQDTALARNTLVFILAHPSREAARQNWAAFGSDPEWREAARQSELSGRIVQRVESVFVDPTDYSPLR